MIQSIPEAPDSDPPPSADSAPGSLRRLALRGAFWSVLGHGTRMGVRLGGNLALTRLLFPEAFGVMALVQVVLRALEMFSDVGVAPSVIKSDRVQEPSFLNTAWTIQVIRGASLTALGCLLAWPAAWFYGKPELFALIAVVSLGSFINAWASPEIMIRQKRISVRPLVLIEVVSQVIALTATVVCAILAPSVWALVVSGLVRSTVYVALSYRLSGDRPRLTWDREVAREIGSFGKWIFISTALTFLLQQGDKAVLGKFVSSAELGVVSIAMLLSRTPLEVILRLNSQVLFPIFAKSTKRSPAEYRRLLFRSRRGLLLAFLPVLWVLIVFGAEVVELLFDPRYHEAGWMLRILALGIVGAVISSSGGSVLLANGDSFRFMLLQAVRGAALIVGMAVGAVGWGFEGMIVGIAASKVIDYPAGALAIHKYRSWLPGLDFAAFGSTALVAGLGFWWL